MSYEKNGRKIKVRKTYFLTASTRRRTTHLSHDSGTLVEPLHHALNVTLYLPHIAQALLDHLIVVCYVLLEPSPLKKKMNV